MRIKAYATMRDILGQSKIELPLTGPVAIREILAGLADGCPAFARALWDSQQKLTGHVAVFINGKAIQYLSGLDSVVEDDDTLSLFPPVAGG